MSDAWKVRVETKDGQIKEFLALSSYELTDEHKLLWETYYGREEVTNLRIKTIVETREKKEG